MGTWIHLWQAASGVLLRQSIPPVNSDMIYSLYVIIKLSAELRGRAGDGRREKGKSGTAFFTAKNAKEREGKRKAVRQRLFANEKRQKRLKNKDFLNLKQEKKKRKKTKYLRIKLLKI